MKDRYNKLQSAYGLVGAIIIIVLIILAFLSISFLITTGIYWIITLCFSLAFSWKWAVGVWLIIMVLRSIFRVTVTNKTGN